MAFFQQWIGWLLVPCRLVYYFQKQHRWANIPYHLLYWRCTAPTVRHALLLSTKGQKWTHYVHVCAYICMHVYVCMCPRAHGIPRHTCEISFLIPLFKWISKIKLRSPDFYMCWLLSQLTSPDTVCVMPCPCTSHWVYLIYSSYHMWHTGSQVARFIQNNLCAQAEVKCEHMGYDSSSASATAQESIRQPVYRPEPCSQH